MSSTLHGTIVHRFQLPRSSSDVPVSKKNRSKTRKATPVEENGYDVDSRVEHCNCCGFIFVPYDESHSYKECLLSFPKNLFKSACDATRSGCEVLIRKYNEIPLLEHPTAANSTEDDSLPSSSTSSSGVRLMVEVHELDLLPASYQEELYSSSVQSSASTSNSVEANGKNSSSRSRSTFWTLAQFWRKELVDFESMKNSRPRFTILATVDAISPIVSMDPSNPFALIEAYDKNNTDMTCVIVLHGNHAMVNHSAIHPSDTLLFRDVVYKAWSVPQLLQKGEKAKHSSASSFFRHLKGRIPSHVFVATRTESVSWNHSSLDSSLGAPSHANNAVLDAMPPIITPVNLTTMIQGRIYNVSTQSVLSGLRVATVIHSVDMFLIGKRAFGSEHENSVLSNITSIETVSENSRTRCRLHLSHFPMSMALQWSLRPGAILEAHNVHLIPLRPQPRIEFDSETEIFASYGACLRSTLLLLKHATGMITPVAGKASGNQRCRTNENTESVVNSVRTEGFRPFSTQPYDQTIASTHSRSLASQPHRLNFQPCVNSSNGHHDNDGNGSRSIDLKYAFLNHGFRKIDRSYMRTIVHKLVEDWKHRNFEGPFNARSSNGRLKEPVPKTWIVNMLLNFARSKSMDKDSEKIANHDENHGTSIPPQTKQKQPSSRIPYFEFFDHSFAYQVPKQIGDGVNEQDLLCGCHLSMEDRKYSHAHPFTLLDLDEIRVASQHFFESHISSISSSQSESQSIQQLRKGFNGSIRVTKRELFPKLSKNNTETDNERYGVECYVGGFVSEMHTHASFGVASIADGTCQVPICFDDRKSYHAGINDFIVGHFDGVVISCLCVGNLPKEFTKNEKEDVSTSDIQSSAPKSLSFPTLNAKKKQLWGNCSLVAIRGLLFVTAIQIHCDVHHRLQRTSTSSKGEYEGKVESVTLTVEECLETQMFLSEAHKSSTLIGMVTRCQFYSKMNLDGSYKCCRLMISSLKRDEAKRLESDNSCLQTFEMSLSVMPNTARMIKFNEMLDIVWPGVNLTEGQKILGSSFWVLGDSGRTCALTFGGSDDMLPGSSCSESSTKVHFPCSSLQLTDLGYTLSLCTQDRVDAIFENLSLSCEENEASHRSTGRSHCCMFDFVGCSAAMKGKLNRRPSRKCVNQLDYFSFRPIGELDTEPSNAIPLSRLSDLNELVYQSLRKPFASRTIMNPTLVRRVSNCRLVALSFCRVQCYCTRCHCSLVHPSVVQRGSRRLNKRKRKEGDDEVSFWHLPYPEGHSINADRALTCNTSIDKMQDASLPPNVRSSNLHCPKKKCSKKMFGVKWECSGILDDGTGQATLYADGDAALTLLGMSAGTIQIIEEGVWSTPGGSVQFMKSIPPPKQLRDKVLNILATKRSNNESQRKESRAVNFVGLLSAPDRVMYLLERHCRVSNRPRRYLDYYVRCKPLVNNHKRNMIPHLQHTKINNFFKDRDSHKNGSSTIYRGQVSSYTAPPLKLELVDCGVHAFETLRPRAIR